jgi:hypothetical protein
MKREVAMSEQDGRKAIAQQRPTTHDQDEWQAYWDTLGQPWRTEPEIDAERQKYLVERRSITPDIEQGIYPFKDIKLSSADIEWLLATHEEGRGPIFWSRDNNPRRLGLDLRGADLRHINLRRLPLAFMRGGLFFDAWLRATEEQRNMAAVQLQGANLRSAELQGAYLRSAQLQGALLRKAQLQGADLRRSDLDGASLDGVTLSDGTYGSVLVADVRWGEVNLAVVDWGHVTRLGDEQKAHQKKDSEGETKDNRTRIDDYKEALRANRQLAIVLREQGLNEVADHFAYRAQLLQRKVLWHQHEFGRWLFSVLLALLSGYGYRIWRILAAYIVMVSLFALAYFVLGIYYAPHLPLDQAFLESITAFHGRVFLEQFSPNTPQIWFTALEALAGLIIEGVFIAMLIQRFFGK